MLTIAQLINFGFQLGLAMTFQSVTPENTVYSYYSEEHNQVFTCVPANTELGKASICPTGNKSVIVYITRS